jgi:plastocyanin
MNTVRATRIVLAAAGLATVLAGAPASGGHANTPCPGSPLEARHKVNRIRPRAPGTVRNYCVYYGPYTIPPGHDLSRVDIDLSLADGFLIAGGPGVVTADGSEPKHQTMHIHHAHWWFLDPTAPNYGPNVPGWKWIAGSGEEETEGSFNLVADAMPGGPRYGIAVRRGERTLLINMLHNKTAETQVVWVKVHLTFAHGTAEQIREETGQRYRNLTPVLHGGTFDVPRGAGGADGLFTYPFELAGKPDGNAVPGVGRVWEAPFSGVIVIGAGHLHPGGRRAIVTNMGSEASPCPNTRADGIPGTTMYELDVLDRVAPNSEDFQIEITQPGFRAWLRKGDRIALNGIYESAEHAWWDAMTHTGFYVDERPVSEADACRTAIVGKPPGWTPPMLGSYPDLPPWEGVANRAWYGKPDLLCGPGLGPECDQKAATWRPGPGTSVVTIGGFSFVPGALGSPQGLGPPSVRRGTQLRFVNADLAAYIRHTVTSCPEPCNGPYVANYPLPDGFFDSGFLGYEPTTGGGSPVWTLDTTGLQPGRYTYFCRVHPWMRGAFALTRA